MSLEAILGGLISSGMGGTAQSRMTRGAGAGGIEDALGALLGATAGQGGGAANAGLGGLAASVEAMMKGGGSGFGAPAGGGGLGALLGAVLGGAGSGGAVGGAPMAGGASAGGAPQGGLGDMLGALLGGAGGRSASGGAAMAVLGGLALKAFQSWQAQAGAAGAVAQRAARDQAPTLTDGDAATLVLRAMLGAAKADGKLDKAEIAVLTARLEEDGETSPEERALIDAELARPADPEALAALSRSPAQAAQIYAASIMAIEIDTEAERAYLRALAQALRLPAEAVAELHRVTGAPAL